MTERPKDHDKEHDKDHEGDKAGAEPEVEVDEQGRGVVHGPPSSDKPSGGDKPK